MKKKNLLMLLIILAFSMLLLAACGGSGQGGSTPTPVEDPDKVYVIKVGYENQPSEPTHQGALYWQKLVEERSDGRLVLSLYPSSQLGTKVDAIEQMLLGANVIYIADASFLMSYVPDIGILSGPYLGNTFDDLFKITESDWFKEQEKELQSKGLHIVSTKWVYGTRHLLTKVPVQTPADLQGVKIRVPNNNLFIKTLEAMGATPTPIPWGDVYPALAQGVVEGAENPLPVLWASNQHEISKHLVLTGHMNMISQWVGSQEYLESLPPELLQILKETSDEAGIYAMQFVEEQAEEALENFRNAGVTIHEVDRGPFQNAVKGIYNEFPEWTPGLYDKLMDIINK